MPNLRTTPIHPGEVLLEVYMKASEPPFSVAGLSLCTRVPWRHIRDLIHGNRMITRPIAARLGEIRHTTPDYWMGLQKTYDTQVQKRGMTRARRPRKGQISETIAA
ncbi:MAG: HigA family addiction module antidote protein [Nitrospirae bacterium]|nr:HigA family addiction module antidote protein [Nitrospirota bacterium]